jgi:hypothetical protein
MQKLFRRRCGRPYRALLVTIATCSSGSLAMAAPPATERIAAEITRWSAFLRTAQPSDEIWSQIKAGSEPELARASQALRDGHPWLALERLAPVAINLGAAEYVAHCTPEQRSDLAAFEAERTRMGGVLADGLAEVKATEFDDLQPALPRALAEIARLQVRAFYAASLEYAQSTDTKFGLFYVGQAQAARDFIRLCREVAAKGDGFLVLHPIAAELASLNRELLVAYRPPAALLFHDQFIAASSLINDAVELDAAGLRFGALLRYLQATLQSAPLRKKPEVPAELRDAAGVSKALTQVASGIAIGGGEGTIALVFIDAAQEALAGPAANLATATTTLIDVLPRNFASTASVPPTTVVASAPRPPRAIVTLVRWPYT